ncbi:peptide chain release factor N(5)-glutamine methyltransferase [Ferrovibrio sp.]|uniref:peptide chain release factor N(5)-glutamine methyltransferase n=1 Tax=Ferrovibrio sp. TaxID=1917215 RepID=UPI0035B2A4EE
MTDVAAALRDAAGRLKAAGCDTPRLDAVLLLAQALGITPDRVRLSPDMKLDADAAARFAAMLVRRAAREPVSHILGRREFWGLDFKVSPAVLDPRPDSETLVQAVLDAVPDRKAALRLVDFGTGSGCLLLALLHELPKATGLGVDASGAALDVARDNAARLGLAGRANFVLGDWGVGLAGPFDILISNPPYIETAAIAGLADDVRKHEPLSALDGGADGLDCYRRLLPDMARLAAGNAILALEVGQGQADAVAGLLASLGGVNPAGIARIHDLGGVARVVQARNTA